MIMIVMTAARIGRRTVTSWEEDDHANDGNDDDNHEDNSKDWETGQWRYFQSRKYI